MPFICHTHNGLYVKQEGREGCQDVGCITIRNSNPPKRVVFGAVPGGTTAHAIARDHSDKFHKDMYSYKDARDQGLKPKNITVKESIRAERIANGAEQEWDQFASKV